jgi:hypothetical protein
MIYLLDLNFTLVANSAQKARPFARQIEQETYRAELLRALHGCRVFLVTARPERYKDATLASLKQKMAWQPERAYFNPGMPPPAIKEAVLLRLTAEFPGETFTAIESNPKTRAMYARHGVQACTWKEWLTNANT